MRTAMNHSVGDAQHAAHPSPSDMLPDDLRQRIERLIAPPTLTAAEQAILALLWQKHDVLALTPRVQELAAIWQMAALVLQQPVVVVTSDPDAHTTNLGLLPRALQPQTVVLTSGLAQGELVPRLRAIATGGAQLIYLSLDRCGASPILHALGGAQPGLLVVAEVHRLGIAATQPSLDLHVLIDHLPKLGTPRLLLATACAPPLLQADVAAAVRRTLTRVVLPTLPGRLRTSVQRCVTPAALRTAILAECTPSPATTGVVATATIAEAVALAADISSGGQRVALLTGALAPEEQAAVVSAQHGQRLDVVVATVDLLPLLDLTTSSLFLQVASPPFLDDFIRQRAVLGGAEHTRCRVVWMPSADRPAPARPTREHLRAVYAAVRGGRSVRITPLNAEEALWRIVYLPDLLAEARASQQYPSATLLTRDTLTQSLALLHMAGLVRLSADLPRAAMLRLPNTAPTTLAVPPDNPLWQRLAAHWRARSPDTGRLMVHMLALCRTVQCTPPTLDALLLSLAQDGSVSYRPVGRGLLLAIPVHLPDAAGRVDAVLDAQIGYDRQQGQVCVSYIETTSCHACLLVHYASGDAQMTCADHRPLPLAKES